MLSDLSVLPVSHALASKRIDLIVSGSIAAVESVRFVRALRRLGAEVRVIMTPGAQQFITPLSLEWASHNPVQSDFSGLVSHLGESDALVVAPASANFLAHAARSYTDHPAHALFQSYLGQNKPVLVLPCMHDSLENSPLYRDAVQTIRSHVIWLENRREEGKQKFPAPDVLADQIAHHLNLKKIDPVLLTMGGTRVPLDDVRSLSNISTGKLGQLIAHELYRYGYQTHIICGVAQFTPENASYLAKAETFAQMQAELQKAAKEKTFSAAIFAAAVSDFQPQTTASGKMKSGMKDLMIHLIPTPKLIEIFKDQKCIKIGFKLEEDYTTESIAMLRQKYITDYQLAALVLNRIRDVDPKDHKALVLTAHKTEHPLANKQEIAAFLQNFITTQISLAHHGDVTE